MTEHVQAAREHGHRCPGGDVGRSNPVDHADGAPFLDLLREEVGVRSGGSGDRDLLVSRRPQALRRGTTRDGQGEDPVRGEVLLHAGEQQRSILAVEQGHGCGSEHDEPVAAPEVEFPHVRDDAFEPRVDGHRSTEVREHVSRGVDRGHLLAGSQQRDRQSPAPRRDVEHRVGGDPREPQHLADLHAVGADEALVEVRARPGVQVDRLRHGIGAVEQCRHGVGDQVWHSVHGLSGVGGGSAGERTRPHSGQVAMAAAPPMMAMM